MDIHLADGQAFMIFEQIDIEWPDRFHDRVRPLCARCFQGQQHRLHSQTDQERGASPGVRQAPQTVGAASGRVCRADEPLRDFAFARFFDPVPRQAGAADARGDRLFPYFGRAGFGSDPRRKDAAVDRSLDTLMGQLPAADFYRANRQFIVSRRAIADLSVWFGSRLTLNLCVKTPERIVISKARVPEFKRWFLEGV